MHARWHATAQRLLGLPVTGYSGADYIGNLIKWRADALAQLQRRIAEESGRRWDTAVPGERAFSEYIIYGVFVDVVLGVRDQRPTQEHLGHAGWLYGPVPAEGIAADVDGVGGGGGGE